MCDLPLAYICKTVKARKDHRCFECRGTIKKGETYHRHSGIWDDGPQRFKVCEDCDNLRNEVDKDLTYDDEKTAFGFLCESVSGDDELQQRFDAIKTKRQSNERR